MLTIRYGVSKKEKGKRLKQRYGCMELNVPDGSSIYKHHEQILQLIQQKEPGWSVDGYYEVKPLEI